MAKLKTLSGRGFQRETTRRSHIKLRRILANGSKQTLVLVMHSELDKGTLHAIFRQACRHISETELRPHFYAED